MEIRKDFVEIHQDLLKYTADACVKLFLRFTQILSDFKITLNFIKTMTCQDYVKIHQNSFIRSRLSKDSFRLYRNS